MKSRNPVLPSVFSAVVGQLSRSEQQSHNPFRPPQSIKAEIPDRKPGEELLPTGYMRQKELMKLVPFSSATLWRLVQKNKFVQPVRLSERITAWNRAEVHQWLRAKEDQK